VITVISRFRVRNGLEEEVQKAFLSRPRLVEKASGFRGLDVLTDAGDPSVFLLLTRWSDEESFRAWHRSDAHHQSHGLIPQGLKLDSSFTSLTIANSIGDPAGSRSFSDALEGQAMALSQWLMECDAVCALLLAPDGSIRARNQAGYRLFPPDKAGHSGSAIADYLVSSDAEQLRQRLSESAGGLDNLLLNLTDGLHNPITLEVGLVRCDGAILLLGTPEHRQDARFQTEILKLTNDLSVMVRESARKNRELEEAKEAIERLARTDALTALANRRAFDEALRREIARSQRLGDRLSVALADLDHFKSINDRYGHITGDHVLASAAAIFGRQMRPYDMAARYGGEEFVLLLPGTSIHEAIGIAERIRKEVELIELSEHDGKITVSFGVASWAAGETPAEFVGRADAALYDAKSAGRNRVEAASDVCA
jgi:diguanylate cyclase (GGDEF)-like protein